MLWALVIQKGLRMKMHAGKVSCPQSRQLFTVIAKCDLNTARVASKILKNPEKCLWRPKHAFYKGLLKL